MGVGRAAARRCLWAQLGPRIITVAGWSSARRDNHPDVVYQSTGGGLGSKLQHGDEVGRAEQSRGRGEDVQTMERGKVSLSPKDDVAEA